ncbi:hypothetical protein PYW08_012103 [Mythimna loreyi]|uniref:Uncharacterized protein n=1 Tax=Mythimna loreyi TaxID=667449 RepID=A0ACC2Q208_9NEOP|nr:hypothetical protein PYW08_012103 [Mythimna loreyi]
MKVCTCFLVSSIFALTNSISQIQAKEKHKSNNAALEAETENINDKIGYKNYLAKVKYEKKNSRKNIPEPEVLTFTDFILETVDILNTYEIPAFEAFFRILDIEIRKYHYDGCKFSELIQNRNTRTLLAAALKSVEENTATYTKANINKIADMIRIEMYDNNVEELLNYINSLYINSAREFDIILNNLKLHTKMKSRRSHNDLEHVIRDGVRTIFFNHYTKLDTKTRRELKEKIEIFWEKIKKGSPSNDDRPDSKPAEKTEKDDKVRDYKLSNSARKHSLDQRKSIVDDDTTDESSEDNEKEKEITFERDTNFPEEPVSGEWYNSKEVTPADKMTTSRIPRILIAQEMKKIKDEKENANTPSRFTETTASSDRNQPKALREGVERVDSSKDKEQENESPKRHDNAHEIRHFNKYVHKKIGTIENELMRLKHINDLRARLIELNADDETTRNVTDAITILDSKNKRKFLKTNIVDLLKNYYDLNKHDSSDESAEEHNTIPTREITTDMPSTIRPQIETIDFSDFTFLRAKPIYDRKNFDNKPVSEVLRNNNTTTINTEEQNKKAAVESKDAISESPLDYAPTAGNTSTYNMTISNQNQIIRHKNPFDFIALRNPLWDPRVHALRKSGQPIAVFL